MPSHLCQKRILLLCRCSETSLALPMGVIAMWFTAEAMKSTSIFAQGAGCCSWYSSVFFHISAAEKEPVSVNIFMNRLF